MNSANSAHVTHLMLATRNAHKTREFAALLGREFTVHDLNENGGFAAVEETGRTFEENATLKAVAASRVIDDLVVADDSGLQVEALDGAPGIRSARYAGEQATDEENVGKLLRELNGSTNRVARFCCVIAAARNGKVIARFVGEVEGTITTVPSGSEGFGYDPIFVPKEFSQTFAKLGDDVKNRISHRAMAVARLRYYLLQGA